MRDSFRSPMETTGDKPILYGLVYKLKPVFDCHLLNPFVITRKVKLEYLKAVPTLVSQGDFMSTDDLEKGYWQIMLKSCFQKTLMTLF